ncbi:hypothetical protein GJ744_002982 [Endocarpon pusillum]|uniref:Uncharacterized protein n=1 Tax=Endocarpon pusillum TaxID=364733 RepID=A0A8H7AA58_9EURO|nr:hypothetical protein GJ744_002982 [Endocarpon pusillum]
MVKYASDYLSHDNGTKLQISDSEKNGVTFTYSLGSSHNAPVRNFIRRISHTWDLFFSLCLLVHQEKPPLFPRKLWEKLFKV